MLSESLSNPLLQVNGLWVRFSGRVQETMAVRGLSFDIRARSRLGIVGESGSGKSTTLLAIIRLLPRSATIDGGSIIFDRRDLVKAAERDLERLRGAELSIIFQNAMHSLNPLIRVGTQIEDVLLSKRHLSRDDARRQAVEILGSMGIVKAAERARDLPFQYSGGMAQRAMIGLAIACAPKLLLADEPTTGLDPLVQEQVLEVMLKGVEGIGASVVIVSHDIHVIANSSTDILVMYGGEAMELGKTGDVLNHPINPYARGLVKASQLGRSGELTLSYIPGRVRMIPRTFEGCSFSGRCPLEAKLNFPKACVEARPPLTPVESGHSVACHFVADAMEFKG